MITIIKETLNKNRIFDYDIFEETLYNFFTLFINKKNLKFKKMRKCHGFYNQNSNKIVINKKIIKDIYNGNIPNIFVIFHELAHYEINEKIINNELDEYLYKIIVEQEFINYEKKLKSKVFYIENYKVCTIENYADFIAIKNTFKFFEYFNIKLTESEFNFLNYILKKSEFNLKIDYRSFYLNKNFKYDYLTIQEMFNYLKNNGIDFEKKYPQLNKQKTKKIQF